MRLPLVLLTLIFISACNNAEESAPAETQPASFKPVVPTIPDLTLTSASGQSLSLASFRGKKVFVNLWATWCGPCREEIPSIQRLQAKIDSSKTAFVMLSLDDNFEQAIKYATNNKMTLPVYAPATALPSLFQVQGIPVTYVFNEAGELIYRKDGAFDYDTPYFTGLLEQKDTATVR
ncbi:MAG: TlpA disulfide reductase family protein [Chitinophagaceae bacterium]